MQNLPFAIDLLTMNYTFIFCKNVLSFDYLSINLLAHPVHIVGVSVASLSEFSLPQTSS